MTKTTTTKTKKAAKPFDWMHADEVLGEKLLPFDKREKAISAELDALRDQLDELQQQVGEKEVELRFVEEQVAAAVEAVESVDVSKFLAMKIYDRPLRECLEKMEDNGVEVFWPEFIADGATDAEIMMNLAASLARATVAPVEGWAMRLGEASTEAVFGRTDTPKPTLAGKALVAEIRRVMGIGQPPKGKPEPKKKPAAKSKEKTAAGHRKAVIDDAAGVDFVGLMGKCKTADEARTLFSEHELAINALQRSMGLKPTCGNIEKNYSRGFTCCQKKDWISAIAAAKKASGVANVKELERLIAEGHQIHGAMWDKLLAEEHDAYMGDDIDEEEKTGRAPKAAKKAKAAAKSAPADHSGDVTEKIKPGDAIPGDWMRAARKAMKRRKLDPQLVTDGFPWAGWHDGGYGPAEAVKLWEESKRDAKPADHAAGAGKDAEPAKPTAAKKRAGKKAPAEPGTVPSDGRAYVPTLIYIAKPSGPVGDADIEYDPFDLGLSPGDVAAAVDEIDHNAAIVGSGIPQPVKAIVRIGDDDHLVRFKYQGKVNHDRDLFILRPLIHDDGGLAPTTSDRVLGLSVLVDGQERWIGPIDDGILVRDPGIDAKPSKPRLIDTVEEDEEEAAAAKGTVDISGPIAAVDTVPDPDAADGVVRRHRFVREELADAYAGTVDEVREGRVRKWVVIGGKEYVVSGKSDINRGALTRWHLHPQLPAAAADKEKAEGIVARKARASGRPISWDWLMVDLPNGAVAVLGEKKDELILETPGPKAGK